MAPLSLPSLTQVTSVKPPPPIPNLESTFVQWSYGKITYLSINLSATVKLLMVRFQALEHYEYRPVDDVNPTYPLMSDSDTGHIAIDPTGADTSSSNELAAVVRDVTQVYWDITADVREGVKVMEEIIRTGSVSFLHLPVSFQGQSKIQRFRR